MQPHKIISIRPLTNVTYVVRMERRSLLFQSGQFIMLQDPKTRQRREYSIYSGENDDFLEVLVRQIDGGIVSNRLSQLTPGSEIMLDGPFGFFTLRPETFQGANSIWVATGTGISPFHSYVRSYPKISYTLIHGVRTAGEAYDHHDFSPESVVLCTSASSQGKFKGRVTDFLSDYEPGSDDLFYLCGNSRMIGEVFDLLTGKSVLSTRIFSEVYF